MRVNSVLTLVTLALTSTKVSSQWPSWNQNDNNQGPNNQWPMPWGQWNEGGFNNNNNNQPGNNDPWNIWNPWNKDNNNNNQPSNPPVFDNWNPENNNNENNNQPIDYNQPNDYNQTIDYNQPNDYNQPIDYNQPNDYNQPIEYNPPVENNDNGNNQSISIEDGYMQKLNIVNTCPNEARYKQPGKEYPTAQKVTYFSNFAQKEHKMNVILPVGYTEAKKYPVLYFLHGFMGNEDTLLQGVGADTIPTYLFNEGKAKEMIVVLPSEYTAEPGKEVPPSNDDAYVVGYDKFIYELVDSIMPYMEEHFSVATGRENTAICGFSMGGRNSLYIGYKRSDLIGYVGGFSPAPGVTPADDWNGHHPGLFTEDEFRADNPPYVTLISCGTNDSMVGQFPKGYHDILERNHQESIYFEVPGADHDNDAVAAGFYNFVQTCFGALVE